MAANNETYYSSAATRKFSLVDKLAQYPSNAWVSAGRLGVDRETAAGAGTISSGMVAGGNDVSNTQLNSTEILTGNSWFTSSGTLTTATKYIKGFGIVTAAVSSGGFPSGVTSSAQKFNGTSWSSTGSMTSARYGHLNLGTSSAGIAAGGDSTGSPTWLNSTDKFNGAVWSSSGTLITARYHPHGSGVQNSCFMSGGIASGFAILKSSEYFNGSTWSSLTSGLVERIRSAAFGSASNAVCSAGQTTAGIANSNSCELFNGVAFISSPVGMLSTFSLHAADGSGNAGFAAAGNSGAPIAGTTPSIWLNAPRLSFNTLFKGDTDQFQEGGDIVASSAGYYLLDLNFAGRSSNGGVEDTDLITLGKHNDPGAGAWAATGSLLTAKQGPDSAGVANNCLSIGGGNSSSTQVSDVERFTGTAWAATASLSAARGYGYATGLQTAAVASGGFDGPGTSLLSSTEIFNGSAWSSSGSLSGVKAEGACVGVKSSAIAIGGTPVTSQATSLSSVEAFNGSAWSTLPGTLPTQMQGQGATGSRYSALNFGSYVSGGIDGVTQKFNGLTWSTVTSMLLATRSIVAGCGTANSAMATGQPSGNTTTEKYNGSNWSFTGSSLIRRAYNSAAGTSGSLVSFGGQSPALLSSAEKYTTSLPDIAFSGQGAWNISGTYPVLNIENGFSAGSQTASVLGGGFSNASSATALAYLYNGVSWTATGSFNIGAKSYGASAGIQNAALAIAGTTNGVAAGALSSVMSFNGTTWSTATGSVNTARKDTAGCGLVAAAVVFGGVNTSNALITNSTETYNGTAWSVSGALNTNRSDLGGCGTQTAAISVGGRVSGTAQSTVENFNGSVWSANSASVPFRAPYSSGTAGTSTNCFTITRDTAAVNLQAKFNGSTWYSMAATSAVNHLNSNAAGTASAGMVVGGQSTSVTENFTNTATAPTLLKYVVN